MSSPLDDLVSIFSTISSYQSGKNTLILDHDISNQLNYLTDNHFSKFSNDANIDKIIWFDNTENNHDTENSIFDLDLDNHPSIVFLLNLNCDSNLSKLNKFSKILKPLSINNNIQVNIHLIISHPLLSKSIEKYLSINGILGDLSSYHIWDSLLYFQISPNLYSLESSTCSSFNQLFLNNSTLPLQLLAKSLLQLYINSNFKLRITNIYLKGDKSVQFWEIFNRLLNSYQQSLSDHQRKILNDIDETMFMDLHSFYNNSTDFICLDRSNDILSLLLTQLSYSGLCNELFNLTNQLQPIELNDLTEESTVKFNLNDPTDEIYNQIKYLNFSHVGSILNKRAKNLQLEFDKRKNLKDLEEMKSFVNELNNLKLLQSWVQKHTSLAEYIIDSFNKDSLNQKTNIPLLDDDDDDDNYTTSDNLLNEPTQSYYTQLIELQQDILANQLNVAHIFNKISNILHIFNPPFPDIIKLVILTSIVKNGIKHTDFDIIYSELINKYDILKISPILLNLQKLKIIQFNNTSQNLAFWSSNDNSLLPSSAQSILNFNSLSKSLNLLPLHDENENEIRQNLSSNNLEDKYIEADFGYPGYVPVFTRLIQSIYDRKFLNNYDPTTSPSKLSSNNNNQYSYNNSSSTTRAIKYGWNNLDLDQKLHGPTKQEFLVPPSKKKLFSAIIPPKISELKSKTNSSSTIIICAVGGLTWSELATIKYVLNKNSFTKNKKLIVLTTGMITGTQFINSLSNAT